MILDAILLILQGVLNVLLLPLTVVNIVVDLVSGIPIVASFLQVIAYIMPWSNILPLITLTISIVSLKIGISLIKTIWQLIPIL